MSKKICMVSLGCAKNLVDSEILLGGLIKENFKIIKDPNESNIIIVNTCGFLDTAREESIDTILECGELKNTANVEKLLVMGCFSERYGDDLIKELPEVDKFFGTNDHSIVLSYLTGKKYKKDDPDYYRSILTPRHYAYLKITEGCDNVCSFCSIPLMRGLQVSASLENNLIEAQRLADNGVKELLIIGQDTTSYGWDLEYKSSLHELLDVLDTVDNLEWIRLHYAHPAHLHREVIKRFGKLNKLIPYIDMPTQHGSDKILKNMKRGLNSSGIKKRIDALRNINNNMAIRTSIIVGFPGETDKEFKELCDFVKEVEFDRLGVFQYSEEEGTHGANFFKDDIPKAVKNERYEEIMILQQSINYQKNKDRVGNKEKIIIDVAKDEGWSLGRSFRDAPEVDNYVKIGRKLDVGSMHNIEITKAHEYDVEGIVIDG
ncbi:MAG: 30S ribosomal protein S12 methylthiotransferase RimO [Candidatus Marinimicrobia bacterium]|nr:30S ribosomal protein S12 methylthiotransferase RimO [Candidatus Neomarinimicrobiota bacterium]|tara:strand:+ start:3964 stop:5259 length:1296 start_codon:yes stop_codon:yes gene_type:complete